MKITFLTFIITFVLSFLTHSCSKDKAPMPAFQTITQALNANQTYQFELGNFGDEEGASIARQATNFSISSIDMDMNLKQVIYKYVPAVNYVGMDEVIIRTARGSDGVGPSHKIVYTTIKFTITN
jgi:hypothetical protein